MGPGHVQGGLWRRIRRLRLSAQVMKGIYSELLGRLESRGYPLAGARVRVPAWRKAWVALAALAGADSAR